MTICASPTAKECFVSLGRLGPLFLRSRDQEPRLNRDFDTENRGRCKVFSTSDSNINLAFLWRPPSLGSTPKHRRVVPYKGPISTLLSSTPNALVPADPAATRTQEMAMSLASFLCVVVAVLAVVTKAEPSATFVDSRARSTLPMPSSLSTPLFAKKNKKKKGNRAQTTKGFGAPPPTLEERLMSFKNRMPDDDSAPCACGSGRSYTDCCRPFHQGDRQCQTMMDVLR